MNDRLRLALLDMNNGVPNQGMRCLREIIGRYENELDWQEFEVRQKCELPDTNFDIYISSGGPGSPLEGGEWKDKFFELIDLRIPLTLGYSYYFEYVGYIWRNKALYFL